jgi:uncharacterized protein
MKKIIVSEIPEEGIGFDLFEQITHEEIEFRTPVRGFLKVFRTGSEVIIQGVVETTVVLECSRCLKGFDMKINSRIDSVFHPSRSLTRDDNYELRSDELDTEFYRGDSIDLIDFITQEVLLNIPMKPLCQNDCKGLCPKCGADLSVGHCKCGSDKQKGGFSLLIDKILQGKE